ncbi:hypothetical protein V1498_19280 [Peribacillus sp. SCS-26]|uniref:hypothetical protein n=1 Tax=Paraperibacillus marinus TaxID=3115295 RepID=UPI0039066B6E
MKYQQPFFSEDVRSSIRQLEEAASQLIHELNQYYKPVFKEKKLHFAAELFREGDDCFVPGYESALILEISEEEELIGYHSTTLWECQRTWLGLPVTKDVPGSRIWGELAEETMADIREELEEYIEEQLEEVI